MKMLFLQRQVELILSLLAGEANGQYQVVLLHRLGHLTGSFTLE